MQNRITPIPTRNFNAAGEYNNGQIFDRAYCPTGFTVHIPPDPVARLMYYLNSILNCTEMESQSEEIDIYRLAKCTEYLTLTSAEVSRLLKKWDQKMYEYAKNLEFEQAAQIRDEMIRFKEAFFD